MKRYIIFIFLLSSAILFAQEDGVFQEPIMPSPNAAQFVKYGDIPVSYTSGVPNISIPMYSATQRGIQFDMSLSYHAGGFKVSETSSWVGLGWNLNAGGSVTRVINGLPDEAAFGYFDEFDYWDDYIEDSIRYCDGTIGNTICEYMVEASQGQRDLQADEYYYNFGNYSGKIFLLKLEPGYDTAILFPMNDIKVYHNEFPAQFGSSPGGDFWLFVTPDGKRYVFSETETTYMSSTYAPITTWHLTYIEDPVSSERVKFGYDPMGYSYEGVQSSYPTKSPLTTTGYSCSGDAGTGRNAFMAFEEMEPPLISEKVLRYISLPGSGDSILFNIEDDRDDLKAGDSTNRLSNITFYRRSSTGYGAYRSVDFYNDAYFVGSSSSPQYSEYNKRMRLDSIVDSYVGATETKAYRFEYNSLGMPSYFSPDVDHWGFYNGAGNSGLIPAVPLAFADGVSDPSGNSADREANETYSKACLLEKITYPTGGYTEFGYEGNEVYYPSLLEFSSENFTLYSEDDVCSGCSGGFVPSALFNVIPVEAPPLNIDMQEFTLGRTAVIHYSSTVGCSQVMTDKYVGSFIVNTDNGTYYTIPNTQGTLDLPAGNYKTLAVCSVDNYDDCDIQTSINFINAEYTAVTMDVGGVRIKSVRSVDNTGNVLKKEYNYSEDCLAGGTNSSMHLKKDPFSAYNYYYFDEGDLQCSGTFVGKYQLCSYLVDGNGYAYSKPGSDFYYTEVTESQIDETTGDNNGKTNYVYKYTATPLYENLPDVITWVDSEDDTVRTEEYAYTKLAGTTIQGARVKTVKAYGNCTYTQQLGVVCVPPVNYEFSILKSSFTTYWMADTLKTVKEYLPDGIMTNSVSKAYDAATTRHKMMTSSTSLTSLGDVITTKLIYPTNYEYPNETNEFVYDLDLKNIISNPVESYTIKNSSEVIGGSHHVYNTDGLITESYKLKHVPGLVLETIGSGNETYYPSNSYNYGNYSMDGNYDLKYQVDEYDCFGNVLQYQYKNNIKIGFLWGYNNSLPVVKIENIGNIQYNSSLLEYVTTTYTNYSSIDDYLFSQQLISSEGGLIEAAATAWESFCSEVKEGVAIQSPDAQLTFYTYKPGVGITSITDPKGQTIYYKYDDFGRLQYTVDNKGNIMQKHEYNYVP
ncbi:MAG: hypothetical protein JW801_11350 [Bacteroidales bacterium]|nr:hypothetical protein [Bacteroidales bacterium]